MNTAVQTATRSYMDVHNIANNTTAIVGKFASHVTIEHSYPDGSVLPKGAFELQMNPQLKGRSIASLSDDERHELLYLNAHDPKFRYRNASLHPMTILGVINLNPQTFTVLLSPNEKSFTFTPGNAVSLFFDDPTQNSIAVRSYSISSGKALFDSKHRIEITINRVYDAEGREGKGTAFFGQSSAAGKTVYALGGRSGLTVKDTKSHHANVVCIATTTGAAPFRSFLPELLTTDKPIDLLLGFRKYEEDFWVDEFQQSAKDNPKLFVNVTYSREPAKDEPKSTNSFQSTPNHVQNHLSSLCITPNHTMVYLCGNPNMVRKVNKTLINNKGVNPKNITQARYSYSGHKPNIQRCTITSKPLIYPKQKPHCHDKR